MSTAAHHIRHSRMSHQFPLSFVTCKKVLPQGLFIGPVNGWRVYCSNISSTRVELRSARVSASVSTPTQMTMGGLTQSESCTRSASICLIGLKALKVNTRLWPSLTALCQARELLTLVATGISSGPDVVGKVTFANLFLIKSLSAAL